jgi:hypothetical protein
MIPLKAQCLLVTNQVLLIGNPVGKTKLRPELSPQL